MGFQEKYEEYKQRKEAQKFFNANNEYHLDPLDYVMLLAVSIATSTIVSLIFDVIELQLGMSFSIFYIFTGYAVAFAVLKVAKYGSEKTGIICVAGYLIGLWLAIAILMGYTMLQYGIAVDIMFCLKNAFIGMFHSGLITYLFIFAGGFIAYAVGKD